jgi:hypothetical protein
MPQAAAPSNAPFPFEIKLSEGVKKLASEKLWVQNSARVPRNNLPGQADQGKHGQAFLFENQDKTVTWQTGIPHSV